MSEKPKPPVPERRFLGSGAGVGKKPDGKEGGSPKPPQRPTGQLPKR